MPHEPEFTRQIAFDRIGLAVDVPPLTVTADELWDFESQITRYAARHLAPTTEIDIDVHPDNPDGVLYARARSDSRPARRVVLGYVTVSLPGEAVAR
ncbi:hypothetical protein KIK06_29140 [Nocardiopsis sp. EMB25]|uniref:hypothetical protein n=1 Tax=Nocardiopsis sp. EMB25 TaxID=2835867 RepID=UPI002283F73A|nr:hypothetical protein [Nocardiopsis sp. EMB25]MCY9787950.1 hypothetical protein [Nocardiopsis sp. EMB25]